MTCVLPGVISIDMRFIIWKMFPKQDGQCSLSFSLEKFGLGGKEDIEYMTLFRIILYAYILKILYN